MKQRKYAGLKDHGLASAVSKVHHQVMMSLFHHSTAKVRRRGSVFRSRFIPVSRVIVDIEGGGGGTSFHDILSMRLEVSISRIERL